MHGEKRLPHETEVNEETTVINKEKHKTLCMSYCFVVLCLNWAEPTVVNPFIQAYVF
jgi:hypothetical protein